MLGRATGASQNTSGQLRARFCGARSWHTRGHRSSAITKRLNRIIREKLKITSPRYTAYSLRHSFIDACESTGIAEETRMKFVGHQLEGVHGIYGNPYVLPHESELIDTVRFDGIDFSCYAES